MTLCLGLMAGACVPGFPWRSDAGQGGGDPNGLGPCPHPYAGDALAAMDMDLIMLLSDGGVASVEDGGSLPLLQPPQGGRVAYVGVRARNLFPCGVELSAGLRDQITGELRPDNRTVNLRPVDGGVAASVDTSPSTFANLPLCPNQWASRDLFDVPYMLEVSLRDRQGKTATRSLSVTPYCAEADTLTVCACICGRNYQLGSSCMDGGTLSQGDAG